MLNDPPSKETAEEKARRYWRNNSIIREQASKQESGPVVIPINTSNNHLEQLRNFKRDIREIILTRPTEMLNQYLISIQARKNKLLREKLKRLERQDECEL